MSGSKQTVLILGVFGFGFWGVLGYAIGGLETGLRLLVTVALIACVAYSVGSLFRFMISPDETETTNPKGFGNGTLSNPPSTSPREM